MEIFAVVDRFEDGSVVLKADDIGLEINIPDDKIKGTYKEGDTINLTLDRNGINYNRILK